MPLALLFIQNIFPILNFKNTGCSRERLPEMLGWVTVWWWLHSSEGKTQVTQLLRKEQKVDWWLRWIDKCYLGRRDKGGPLKEVTFEKWMNWGCHVVHCWTQTVTTFVFNFGVCSEKWLKYWLIAAHFHPEMTVKRQANNWKTQMLNWILYWSQRTKLNAFLALWHLCVPSFKQSFSFSCLITCYLIIHFHCAINFFCVYRLFCGLRSWFAKKPNNQ